MTKDLSRKDTNNIDIDDRECENAQNCEKECEKSPHAPEQSSETRRRNLLRAVAGGATVSLAGCTGLFTFGDVPEPRERPDLEEDDLEEDDPDEDDPDEDEPDEDEENGDVHQINYIKQGERIDVPEDQSLLVAGEEQGWDLPYDCREGYCGVCTARLWGDAQERVEMEGNQFLDDEEIEDGFTLTCVGYPRSDFTLETGERDTLDER